MCPRHKDAPLVGSSCCTHKHIQTHTQYTHTYTYILATGNSSAVPLYAMRAAQWDKGVLKGKYRKARIIIRNTSNELRTFKVLTKHTLNNTRGLEDITNMKIHKINKAIQIFSLLYKYLDH